MKKFHTIVSFIIFRNYIKFIFNNKKDYTVFFADDVIIYGFELYMSNEYIMIEHSNGSSNVILPSYIYDNSDFKADDKNSLIGITKLRFNINNKNIIDSVNFTVLKYIDNESRDIFIKIEDIPYETVELKNNKLYLFSNDNCKHISLKNILDGFELRYFTKRDNNSKKCILS